jgi:lysine 2,3-aminomutase
LKKYHLINNLEKLETLLDRTYENIDREAFGKFIFQHPLRFTDYLLEQIKYSEAIAKQYIPDPRELEPVGLEKPFTGVMKTGVPGLERMYLDRVILMPTSQCFAYCRFCFRKNYSHDARKEDYGTPQDTFEKAIEYIRNDERIKEVLITGGDPLMFPDKVLELCEKLRTIPHLTSIRIGTRIFTSDPELITEEWIKPIKKFNTINPELVETQDFASLRVLDAPVWRMPAPISISPHINHPDELSPQTIRALLLCTQNNIPLYSQTVMMKDINNDPETLIKLFRTLRQLGVEPYSIYQADPLQGTEYFRTTLEEFQSIRKYLRANASTRIIPKFIVDTRIGKVELGADSEIVNKEGTQVWIKTPFTEKIYQSVKPDWTLPEYCKLDKDGTIIVEYQDAQS